MSVLNRPASIAKIPGTQTPVESAREMTNITMLRVEVVARTHIGMLTSSRMAALAKDCSCRIRVGHGPLWADARDTLDLMSLDAGAGETLTIEARGAKAYEATMTMAWVVAHRNGG